MLINNKIILINILGIQDSGGITVLEKLLLELRTPTYNFFIICNKHKNIEILIKKFSNYKKFKFIILDNKGFIYRLYYENIFLKKLINEKKIDLIYNFSGSSQFFLNIPQITKVHNLLFYSKKIDKVYFEKREYLKWLKEIFLKRVVFQSMLKQIKYLEIQSPHVQDNISNFIDISDKKFFLKSDICILKENFTEVKNYAFTVKINILFIVGPHFEYLHKNFDDFVKAMIELERTSIKFEINITLSKEQLYNSKIWDKSLDYLTNFLGYISKDDIQKQFQDNTILISTSVIETLGLHVIEAIQNGILTITPNENYGTSVYGKNILTYELFDIKSLINTIKKTTLRANNEIKDTIKKNQRYLRENEKSKYSNIIDIFEKVLKDKNV